MKSNMHFLLDAVFSILWNLIKNQRKVFSFELIDIEDFKIIRQARGL